MPNPTPELGLQKAIDSDDTAAYLDTSLANSLTTIDSLFNNSSGHTHGGVHQGGPVSSIPITAIPDGSITSLKIQDGTIQTVDLADSSVTSAKIVDGTIQTVDLADNSVTSAKIADGTITSADMAGGAVGSAQIAAGAVGTTQLASGAILYSAILSNGTLANTVSGSPAWQAGQTFPSVQAGPSGDGVVVNTGAGMLRVETGLSQSVSFPSNSGVVTAVSFARGFSSPPRVIVGLAEVPGQDIANKWAGVDTTSGPTTTGFNWRAYYTGGGNGVVGATWIAIGW
jgi:hypothetical protein